VPVFDHLVSRAVLCWRAKWADPDYVLDGWVKYEEWPVVRKSSWQCTAGEEKGLMLKGLADSQPDVPTNVSHWEG
jgi:hypothetical protein